MGFGKEGFHTRRQWEESQFEEKID